LEEKKEAELLENLPGLNDRFSFQNERLCIPKKEETLPIIKADTFESEILDTQKKGNLQRNTTKLIVSEKSALNVNQFRKKSTIPRNSLIPFRQHLVHDKLVSGKCFGTRALLERDSVKKFIERDFFSFHGQLKIEQVTQNVNKEPKVTESNKLSKNPTTISKQSGDK